MKRLFEYTLAVLLIVILGGIVVHAPLSVYVGSKWPSLVDIVKVWKEFLMLIAMVILVFEITRLKRWKLFSGDRLFWLIIAYAAIHVIALLWSTGGTLAVIAGLAIDLRYILFLCLVYGFLRLYPDYKKLFFRVFLFGAAVVVGFACLQLVLPKDVLKHIGYGESTIMPYLTVDKNPEYVRLNSTLRGPNPLGAYAMIVIVGLVAYSLQFWRSLSRDARIIIFCLWVGSFIALWMSYSRSALIGMMVATAIVVVVHYRKQVNINWPKIVKTLAVGTLAVACVALAVRDTTFVHNVILHDNPSTGESVGSNEGHLSSIIDGMARMARQPLGAGIGSTGSASLYSAKPLIIENQYLLIAHEVGWLGLALFAAIYVVVLKRLWSKKGDWLALGIFASGIGLAVIGILQPVWVDDTVSMVWWGLAGIVIASNSTSRLSYTRNSL